MAKNFILYLPEVGQDEVIWAMANDAGVLTSDPQYGSMAEAASEIEGRRSIVVLPGDNVLLAEASIPGGSQSRAQQAVSYVLEDQVADDIDELHFALGTKSKDDIYPVAVIDRTTMDTLKEQMAEVGLRPSEVVPETLAIPKFDVQQHGIVWTALVDDDHTVVRLNGYKGFASDSSTANMMLSGVRREMEPDENSGMVVFQTSGTTTEPFVEGIEIETRPCDSRLSLFAAGLARSPRINLLQGEYSQKKQFDKAWKPWRWTGILLLALVGIFSAGSILDYINLGKQEQQLDLKIDETFRQALPGVKIRNPVVQMKSRLKQQSAGPDKKGFTIELGQISAAIAALPNTTVKSISYRKGRFDIDLSTENLPALDKLKQDIEKAGSLTMTVQSANRQDGVVRGRIRVEAK